MGIYCAAYRRLGGSIIATRKPIKSGGEDSAHIFGLINTQLSQTEAIFIRGILLVIYYKSSGSKIYESLSKGLELSDELAFSYPMNKYLDLCNMTQSH
jgi:hypothetical protein